MLYIDWIHKSIYFHDQSIRFQWVVIPVDWMNQIINLDSFSDKQYVKLFNGGEMKFTKWNSSCDKIDLG